MGYVKIPSSVPRKGIDVATASAILPPANRDFFDVTGTTTINHISTAGRAIGDIITIQFDGSVTVTHNAGSVPAGHKAILLAGAANFSATASDTLTLRLDDTVWREVGRSVI